MGKPSYILPILFQYSFLDSQVMQSPSPQPDNFFLNFRFSWCLGWDEPLYIYLHCILTLVSSSHATSVAGITRLNTLSSPSSALKRNAGRVDDTLLGVWFFHKTLRVLLNTKCDNAIMEKVVWNIHWFGFPGGFWTSTISAIFVYNLQWFGEINLLVLIQNIKYVEVISTA